MRTQVNDFNVTARGKRIKVEVLAEITCQLARGISCNEFHRNFLISTNTKNVADLTQHTTRATEVLMFMSL